ncbi:MAG: hypothetical protein MJ239_00760 [Bacilli bacterium]|nr:hypothetical protein [Bacilli bacterium]
MIDPHSEFRVGETITDKDENTVKVNSLSCDGDYLIINADLHCNKGDYVAFHYQIQEVEYCRFDLEATNKNNSSAFYPGGGIYYTDYKVYFFGYSKLLQNTEYHIDFGINQTSFASTYFVFSLAEVSPISF